MLRSKVVWEECVDEDVCLKVFGKKECVRIQACVRILFEDSNYFLESEAFGQRWKWTLTEACYNFWEYGIARLRVCASPSGDNGAKIVLEACLGVSGISKCWVLISEDVSWANAERLSSHELQVLETSGFHDVASEERIRSSSGFISTSSSLSASEIKDVLSTESVKE